MLLRTRDQTRGGQPHRTRLISSHQIALYVAKDRGDKLQEGSSVVAWKARTSRAVPTPSRDFD